MSESKNIIKQGELILKSGILKQKHKRWCHLCSEKGEKSYFLECFENKDQRDKPKNLFVLSQVKTIDKVVKESSKDFYIEVHMKKEKFSLLLSGQQETESWYNCLQEYSQFCEGREDSSYGADDDDTVLKDNILYDSQPEETARFDVKLKSNDDTERLGLKSKYRLHVSNVCLMLEDLEKQEPKYKWYYEHLRKYGKQTHDFVIVSGRRSESGEGTFTFIYEDPSKITKAIDRLTKRKHNEQLTSKLNFAPPENEKQVTNRISEPIPKRESSPVPPKKSFSLKDREEVAPKQALTRQNSSHVSSEFKQELANTVGKSKSISEKSLKTKKDKQEGKEDKKKGFGFFKSKDKDKHEKKSKDSKSEQENETIPKPYPKENLYDEPELPESSKKPAEPIYEEADHVPGPARIHMSSNNNRSDEPVMYAQAAPNRQHAWKNHGIQDEEHLENYDSIKAAASKKGQHLPYTDSNDSEEIDDTYDHAFLNEGNRNRQKIINDSKNIYGTAGGKDINIPEPDYEGNYDYGDDEPVEYYDAVSTQQTQKPPPQPTEAYEDVDLPS